MFSYNMFTLEKLDENNYNALSKLKIKESQKDFVLDFQGCVNYKKEYPFLNIYGIKKDDTYIGLTAFARWDSDANIPIDERWTWFDEFFIDEKYQHLGYGENVIESIIDKIKEIYHPRFIVLSVKNNNEPAKHLYKVHGFKASKYVYVKEKDSIIIKDEIAQDDEVVMFRKCD